MTTEKTEGVTPEEKKALLEAMDEGRPKTGLITSMILHYIGLAMLRRKGGELNGS